jgi:hypothetical protein
VDFHKDAEIRPKKLSDARFSIRVPACFAPRAGITAADLATRFIRNRRAVIAAAPEPGPYIYSVQHDRIARLL